MSFAPLFPTPITDFLHWIIPENLNKYGNKTCVNIHMKFGECVETYGLVKSRTKCQDLYYDLCECKTHIIQKQRYLAIQNKRMKQYQEGKLKTPFEEHPPIDSFVYFY